MEKLIRRIGLVAHDAMKKDLIEWVLWNSELLMGHKFYCTGTTGTLIQEALKEKHPDVEWDFTILKSGCHFYYAQIFSTTFLGDLLAEFLVTKVLDKQR